MPNTLDRTQDSAVGRNALSRGREVFTYSAAALVTVLFYAPLKVYIYLLGGNSSVLLYAVAISTVLFLAGLLYLVTSVNRFSHRRDWAELSPEQLGLARRLTILGWLLVPVPLAIAALLPDIGLRLTALVLTFVFWLFALTLGAIGRALQVMVTSHVEPRRDESTRLWMWVALGLMFTVLLGLNGLSIDQRISPSEARSVLDSYRSAIPANIATSGDSTTGITIMENLSGRVVTPSFAQSRLDSEDMPDLLDSDRMILGEAMRLPLSARSTDFNALLATVHPPGASKGKADTLVIVFQRYRGRWLIATTAWD
jgi:hypothetical protein